MLQERPRRHRAKGPDFRWPPLLLTYGRLVLFREFLATGRLSDEEKGTVLFVFGAVLSGPVVVLAPLVVIAWLVTGRGPGRWLGWGQACVNPFPKPDISHIHGATRRAMAEARDEFAVAVRSEGHDQP